MKAIETSYKGYLFRSRLEARWAVFFETLGLKWEYEPEGFDFGYGVRYLPDFRVWYPGRRPDEAHCAWFEVKPAIERISPDEWQKMVWFARERWLTLLDGPPDETVYPEVLDILTGGNWIEGAQPVADGAFVPCAHHIRQFATRERMGVALWSSKQRMWGDWGPGVFHPDPDQSTIGREACLELRRAVRSAREFNMREIQKASA